MSTVDLDPHRLASHYIDVMNAVLAVIEQETDLVRAGRLAEAAELGASKSELAGRYLTETVKLKAGAAHWFRDHPAILEQLQSRHELFRALLQVNLTVLATAHAVAEGVIRGAAGEVARKRAPQGYGAKGNLLGANRAAAQPVALSKAS